MRVGDRAGFGAGLREARGGMSQRAVASAVGCSQKDVSLWENGLGRDPTPSEVFALEEAVGAVPGGLSHMLGFVPAGTAGTVEQAIVNDATLSGSAQAALLAVLAEIRR